MRPRNAGILLLLLWLGLGAFEAHASTVHLAGAMVYDHGSQRWVTTTWLAQYGTPIGASSTALVSKPVQSRVALTAASSVRVAKYALGGPAGVAVLATITAANWVYDEATDSINEPSAIFPHNPDGTLATGPRYTLNPPTCGEAQARTATHWYLGWGTTTTSYYGNFPAASCSGACPADSTAARLCSGSCVCNKYIAPWTEIVQTEGGPVPDQAVADLFTPQEFNFPLQEPLKDGTWPTVIPELAVERDRIQAEFDKKEEGLPHDTTVTESVVPPPSSSASTQTIELPDDYARENTLQGVQDALTQVGEAPSLPAVPFSEIELSTWESGWGTGSCPPSPTFNVQGNAHTYDWTPACTVAGWIRPLVLAAALIASGFILVGVRA